MLFGCMVTLCVLAQPPPRDVAHLLQQLLPDPTGVSLPVREILAQTRPAHKPLLRSLEARAL